MIFIGGFNVIIRFRYLLTYMVTLAASLDFFQTTRAHHKRQKLSDLFVNNDVAQSIEDSQSVKTLKQKLKRHLFLQPYSGQ